MARTRKKYSNGQSRGGAIGTMRRSGKKDYHRKAVEFHGGEMALAQWKDAGMKGYAR